MYAAKIPVTTTGSPEYYEIKWRKTTQPTYLTRNENHPLPLDEITLENLDPGTDYEVMVRSVCTNGQTSVYDTVTFTTPA